MSRFEDTAEQLLEAVRAGVSIEGAASDANVAPATVRRWLTNGRKGMQPYAAFAADVDEARQAQRVDLGGEMTHEEAETIVVAAMRRGSLQACRIWFDMHPSTVGEGVDPVDAFLREGWAGG